MDVPVFSYMRWAKAHSSSHRYDLTISGLSAPDIPPLDDPARPRVMPVGDGDPQVEGLLGERYGVPAEHVLFVPGTTMGMFLLTRALMQPGDRVLVETPVYENLPGLVRLFGGEVVPFERRPEDGYRLDPERIEAGLKTGAKLILLTDLHNPSCVKASDDDLEKVRDLARRHDARIVLDEVYRDYLPGEVGTAYREDDSVLVSASSLTKVYGLGSVRTGWIFAPTDVRENAVHMLDYLTVLMSAPAMQVARHVMNDANRFRQRGLDTAATGFAIFSEWAAERDDLDFVPPAGGLVCFTAVRGIDDTGPLVEWLRTERDTAAVPGSFFGDPGRIRVGLGTDPDLLRQGLAHLGEAIDRFTS